MKIKFTPTNLLAALMLLEVASATNVFQGGRDKTDNGSQNIVGGEVAPVGRYTHTVALANNGFQYCGGSLIAPDVVLTAAHCMDGSAFDVYINRHDKLSNQGESIRRIKETKHPNFDSDTLDNDFAVVILSSATTQDVDFVTLNTDEAYPGNGATSRAMGWGTTSSGGSSSQLLRWVDLPIISNQECSNKYSGGITSSMICTFLPTKDSCQGDSGGPLIIPGNTAAEDTLIGVVSWGIGCATSTYPGVYGRVSNAYDWIKETACKDSQYPSVLCGTDGTSSPVTSQPTAPSPSPTSSPTSSLSIQFTKKEESGYCWDSANEWYSAFKSTALPLSTTDIDCLRWCTQPGAVDAGSLVSVDVLRDGNSVTCYCNYPGGGVPDDIDINDFTPSALEAVIYSGDGPVVSTDGTSGASCYVNNNFGQTTPAPVSKSPTLAPTQKPSNRPTFPATSAPVSKRPTLPPTSSPVSKTPTLPPTRNSSTSAPVTKPVTSRPSSLTPTISGPSTCFPRAIVLKIESTTSDPIHLFEVKVLSSGKDLAVGAKASQSSTFLNREKFSASKAIDQDEDTFSHTHDTSPWWQVELGSMAEIESVEIKNRWCRNPDDEKECMCRLSEAKVSLLDRQGSIVAGQSLGKTCGQFTLELNFDNTFDCVTSSPTSPTTNPTPSPTPSVGDSFPKARYLKLHSITGAPIHLFEMEIYSSGVNVAKGKPASQSSTLSFFNAGRATDGNRNTFSHTNDPSPVWQVDLQGTYEIEYVNIVNRWCRDSSDPKFCLCRLSYAVLSLFDEQQQWLATTSIGDTCGKLEWTYSFGDSGNASSTCLWK